MKLGIIGLENSGKSTVFEALTRSQINQNKISEIIISSIQVPDNRVNVLTDMYCPKKTIFAQVEYLLPSKLQSQNKNSLQAIFNQTMDCNALIHIVRNFNLEGYEKPDPIKDFSQLDQELILMDFMIIEKRIEKIKLEAKRGKKDNQNELVVLNQCLEILENSKPLRSNQELANSPLLRSYALISAKPVLVIINNDDDDETLPQFDDSLYCEHMLMRAKLEREISQMSQDEAADFLLEFNIKSSATDRIIQRSYELLNLMSFFTVGEDEVRAWTIKKKTIAHNAADVIHSDIKKGFIRAEVVAYDDLMEAGNFVQAKKNGKVRLEGKTYIVLDGDIINFRFNV